MSIGEALTAARQRAGLTLAQVSEATCIRETILAAMERDDFSLCGGHFYARGHIRSIAHVVAIDPEPLVEQYDDDHGGSPRATRPSEGIEPTAVSVPRVRRPNWSMAMAIVLVLVVTYGVYRLFTGGPSSGEQTPPVVQVPPSTSASEHPRATMDSARSERAQLAPSSSPSPSPAVASIRFEAEELTWISVSDGEGNQLFTGNLYAGDVERFADEELVRVVIGNTGGVSLTINGENVGFLSDSANVDRLEIYPDRVEGLS